jgi:outer membrane receptor protein involved in Fe transport
LGQSISLGVKAGGRLGDDIATSHDSATSESKRYTAGPMVEFGLPLGLSVEADALYQRQGYRSTYGSFAGTSFSRVSANAWEVPVLLKYRPGKSSIQPYVEAGVSPRLMSGVSFDSSGYTMDSVTGAIIYQRSHGTTDWSNSVGAVFGGGLQFGFGSLRLAPGLRYTHWNNMAKNEYGSQGFEFHSTQNQVDVLLGISWKVR